MKQSAGILLFRCAEKLQVFLVHPGGPYFARKDNGWWTIPKGEFESPEEPLDAAIREFKEETGIALSGSFIPMQPIIQKGGKKVHCWALEGDIDAERISSNVFQIEWPPKSGKLQTFPEIDKAGWFFMEEAIEKINDKQIPLLEQLTRLVG
jgi:predicted NUDIX family NTP pyrophosphohydrolase